jgi:hypothetical protein
LDKGTVSACRISGLFFIEGTMGKYFIEKVSFIYFSFSSISFILTKLGEKK